MSDNGSKVMKSAIIGLSILSAGLMIAIVCTLIHSKRKHNEMRELFIRQSQQQQHQKKQQVVHECRLLDVEDQALKRFRMQLMQKPNEMVPIFNPRFNARMIVIELILLQQHLEYPGMLCKECIARKHMLAIEGYALEAIGLVKIETSNDPNIAQLVQDMNEVARMMRDLQKLFIENPQKNALEIARVVRALRKELSVKYGILPV